MLEKLYYIFSIGAVIIAFITLILTVAHRKLDNKGKPYAYITSAGDLICIVVVNIGKNIITNVWLDLDVCKLGGKENDYDRFTYTLLPGDKMVYLSKEQNTTSGDFVIKGSIHYYENGKRRTQPVNDRLSSANTSKLNNNALATIRKFSTEDSLIGIEGKLKDCDKNLETLIKHLKSIDTK